MHVALIAIQRRNDRQIADIGQAQRSHVVAMYICNVDICWRVTHVKRRQTRITALRPADTIIMIDVFVSIYYISTGYWYGRK